MIDQADIDQIRWDEAEQAAEQRDMAIQSRVDGLWENKADICRIIAENSEELYMTALEAYDAEKAIRAFVDECFTTEASEDLNL